MRHVVMIALFPLAGMLACSDEAADRQSESVALADRASAASQPAASQPATDDPSVGAELRPAAPRAELIPAGEPAAEFSAKDHKGQTLRLSELLEKQRVVLVFYPADFTPGCTKQLCAVRDDWSEFERRNATVLGVNPASIETHARFAEEHGFPFPVISDEESAIAAAYGCKGKDHTQRVVYVIGRDGKVLLSEAGMVPHEKIFAALGE
ncbi:MAG TPA: peroxiredoxin [Phycisphaerae bacterium]|nr:peroxiredoxin [Phycisphaerae bacterium]HOM50500.1 peroxiredoxin [Phycisphaerae bacterium]HON67176.1 peroxiredoxin [Phycisphaerae bacterium]HOQ87640.1 peroxiredoxin [Phycisphaerae bacterium]HPP28273.1 peroxiredoxin [Phycisphaerae bacterium]